MSSSPSKSKPQEASVAHKVLLPLKNPLDAAVHQKAARYAVRVLDEMSKRSQLLKKEHPVAQFDRQEIIPYLGDVLGKGGFNSVYELKKIELTGAATPERSATQTLAMNPKALAVKFLSDEALTSAEEFCNGAADLLMEAKYLTALAAHPHPCLIQLHGVTKTGPAGFANVERAGFFLVIDRLYDTLDRRIDVWREVQRRNGGSSSSRRSTPSAGPLSNNMLKGLFLQRLLVAQDICGALQHLHRLQVIFRDLKPGVSVCRCLIIRISHFPLDNVGFDFEGRVKLFDFGLAKELDPVQRTETGLYNMSGGTGSRRFMAPEVALSEPYNLAADMYSFSIMLWEIMTLGKAFSKVSVDEHRERVIKNHQRLEMDPNWSDNLKNLLELCWKRNPFRRPSAREAHRILRTEIQNVVAASFPKQASAQYEISFNAGVVH